MHGETIKYLCKIQVSWDVTPYVLTNELL